MSRQLTGPDLTSWTVYAAPGQGGFAAGARIVFLPEGRGGPPVALAVEVEGDRAEAERMLASLSAGALLELLTSASPLP